MIMIFKLPCMVLCIFLRFSFLRLAFINMLLDIVYRCRDPDVILEGLRAVSKDTFPGEQSAAYKERMCEETFLCVSQGHFSLEQIREEPAKSVVLYFFVH